jgi:hypothetical protein
MQLERQTKFHKLCIHVSEIRQPCKSVRKINVFIEAFFATFRPVKF